MGGRVGAAGGVQEHGAHELLEARPVGFFHETEVRSLGSLVGVHDGVGSGGVRRREPLVVSRGVGGDVGFDGLDDVADRGQGRILGVPEGVVHRRRLRAEVPSRAGRFLSMRPLGRVTRVETQDARDRVPRPLRRARAFSRRATRARPRAPTRRLPDPDLDPWAPATNVYEIRQSVTRRCSRAHSRFFWRGAAEIRRQIWQRSASGTPRWASHPAGYTRVTRP